MGASRARVDPALVPNRVRPAGSAASWTSPSAQILGDDTALGALPAVLERLVATFGLRAALAFQPSAGQPATVLAAHPAASPSPRCWPGSGRWPWPSGPRPPPPPFR